MDVSNAGTDGTATLPAPRRLAGKRLPPALVAAEQRHRILAAVPVAVAGRGFDRTFVEHIIGIAAVSRPTFYEQFDNCGHVFDVACEEGFARLQAVVTAAFERPDGWPRQVGAAIVAALGFVVAEPLLANLLLVETVASGARMSGRYYEWLDRLVPGLRRGRAQRPGLERLPALTEQALLGALAGLIAQRLHAGKSASLSALAPQLTELTLTPYLGVEQARRQAAGRPR